MNIKSHLIGGAASKQADYLAGMKNIVLFFLILLVANPGHTQNKANSVFAELNSAIDKKQQYVRQKEAKILALKKIREAGLLPVQEYKLNNCLYNEYRKFKLDSSIYYVNKNLEIARALKRKDLLLAARIQLADLYSTTGRYRESETILKSINKKQQEEVISFIPITSSLFFI